MQRTSLNPATVSAGRGLDMNDFHGILRRARGRARYSQDEVGAALGVSRTMVSYWEAGQRTPNDRQRDALARLYGIRPVDLVEGPYKPPAEDLARMLLRADPGAAPEAVPGIREFIRFLDRYSELAKVLETPIHGMKQSPFVHRSQFVHKEDIRRKAEEVRAHLGLGIGPISDLDPVCARLGVTLYREPLGRNLARVPSGAFFNHPDVGFAILVNLDMTPGRRRFTTVHELAHALFHSHKTKQVISRGKGPLETFADTFAGEFLMPSEGVRHLIEESGMPPRLVDADDVIHIQRYFRVSWPTALVRLRQMNAIAGETYRALRDSVRPVALARSLGYVTHPEEYVQDTEMWRVRRFPRLFLRMLCKAVVAQDVSVPTAASLAGLSVLDVTQMLGQGAGHEHESPELSAEFSEFEETGVI